MSEGEPSVDSEEGIGAMMHFARVGGFVLNEYHEDIARKYGVSTEGVVFARPVTARAASESLVDDLIDIANRWRDGIIQEYEELRSAIEEAVKS